MISKYLIKRYDTRGKQFESFNNNNKKNLLVNTIAKGYQKIINIFIC